jgi:hypothetical protein
MGAGGAAAAMSTAWNSGTQWQVFGALIGRFLAALE